MTVPLNGFSLDTLVFHTETKKQGKVIETVCMADNQIFGYMVEINGISYLIDERELRLA